MYSTIINSGKDLKVLFIKLIQLQHLKIFRNKKMVDANFLLKFRATSNTTGGQLSEECKKIYLIKCNIDFDTLPIVL